MRPKKENDSSFISYAINEESRQILKYVTGSLVSHISAKGLCNVQIPIPHIEKQREFVDIASKQDNLKQNLVRSISNIDSIIKGLING